MTVRRGTIVTSVVAVVVVMAVSFVVLRSQGPMSPTQFSGLLQERGLDCSSSTTRDSTIYRCVELEPGNFQLYRDQELFDKHMNELGDGDDFSMGWIVKGPNWIFVAITKVNAVSVADLLGGELFHDD